MRSSTTRNGLTCLILRAALAVWAFCEDSATQIWGDMIGDDTADKILAALDHRLRRNGTHRDVPLVLTACAVAADHHGP